MRQLHNTSFEIKRIYERKCTMSIVSCWNLHLKVQDLIENTTVLWTDIWTIVACPDIAASRYWTGICVTFVQNAQWNPISFVNWPHLLHVTPSPCWFTRNSPPQNLSSLSSLFSHSPKCITSCLTYPQPHLSDKVSPGILYQTGSFLFDPEALFVMPPDHTQFHIR